MFAILVGRLEICMHSVSIIIPNQRTSNHIITIKYRELFTVISISQFTNIHWNPDASKSHIEAREVIYSISERTYIMHNSHIH